MIKLIEKQKIIIAYYNMKKSQRTIAQEFGLNRRTVARYIRDYEQKREQLLTDNKAKEELIADIIKNPSYDTSSRKKVKLTEEIIERIRFYLKENEQRQKDGRHKQQRKKIDIYETLCEEGFAIGYTTVCNSIGKIQRQSREAYIRQEYAPGEVCEFDWGEVKLTIAGKKRTLQMASFSSTWGDYRFAKLYANQKTESFLDANASFFEAIGGVYKEMVYDNARVMVARFVGRSEKEPTEALLKLSLYYGFRFRFTNTYQAHEKGHAERSVEYLRRKIFSRRDTFNTMEEVLSYFQEELLKLNTKCHQGKESAYDLLEKEKDYLLVLPPRYDTAHITESRVDSYSTVSVDGNHYSVPDHLVGEFVLVKCYPHQVLCYHNGDKVASHPRSSFEIRWSLDISHYLNTLKLKPGALRRSSAFLQMKPRLKDIYQEYYQGQEKEFLKLLELIAKYSLTKVNETIVHLEKIPTKVNTEKIQLILEKKEVPPPVLAPSAITRQAKETLSHYSKLLGGIPV